MKQRNLDKLNTYLATWRGADAFLNTYVDEHERLVIGFARPDNSLEFVGICFLHCVFLSGPTRWSNCDVKCHNIAADGSDVGVELRDAESGFLLRFEGAAIIGSGDVIFPGN